jgi:hypothetical protein
MVGKDRKQLEALEKSNNASICSVRVGSRVKERVDGRVALRGICGRVRVADIHVMHVVSGEICTDLHAGCDGEVSCMCV